MGLFNSSNNRKGRKKENKELKPNLRTFILEPILTPSGLIDGSDDVPDLVDLPDNDDLDFVEEVAEITSVGDEELSDDGSETLDFFSPDEFAEIESTFTSGYFTVGDSGDVEVDFLFDGGGYRGELAIFSLEGMEEFEPGSEEFIAEAANRALSDSELGHVVISDRDEGARFSGQLGGGSPNGGKYLGVKTFNMEPGDSFGFMLVPNGRVEEVVTNPDIGGAKTPLFSLVTANPEDGFHFGQIADVTGDGHTFALEDLRVDGKSDGDYNDIIFQVKGATGEVTLLDEVIDPDLDWREEKLATELLNYAESQSIEADFSELLASLNLDQSSRDNLERAFNYVSGQLEDFVNEPDFVQRLNLAFGDSWDEETASNLLNNIISKQQLPSLQVVSFNNLNANGAFGEGTIYISEEFLQQNLGNPEAVGKVILEELGHYLDSQLNSTDSPGDEGAIFAAVVSQDGYSPLEIAALQGENDVSTLILPNRQEVQVELVNDIPDINVNDVSVWEGDSGTTDAVFTVSLSESSSETVTVRYSISGAGATHGEDYQAVSGTLTFSPGDISADIVVPVMGDTFGETDEDFYLSLYNATNANIATSFAQGTILNDDGSPPALSIANASVIEGDTNTNNAVFDVSLSEAGAQPITVSFFTYDNDATEGEDYQSVSGTLTFTPGETDKSIVVPIIGDTFSELDEIFRLSYSVKNASASNFYAQGTILNDDGSPPTLSILSTSVTEGDTSTTDAVFDVSLSEASTQTITVDFYTSDGYYNGAISGEDYQSVSGTLTFTPGETDKSIVVPVIGDTLWEPDETFGVDLYNATNAGISQFYAQGTILNNDAPPPDLSIANSSITEGDSGTTNIVFDVSLSEASTQPITVNFNTSDGYSNGARAGEDYQAVSGTVTFAPGETLRNISVPVIGDTFSELDETFRVSLSGATNASITQSYAQGTILNDDGSPPALSIANASATEGDANTTDAVFDISLSEAGTQPITVSFSTSSYYDEATPGEDYQTVSGTLTFTPGETLKSITVPIIGDTLGEPDEIFGVNIYNASNASVDDSSAQGTILNDDGAILALSIDDVSVDEGNSGTTDALFTVSLSEAGTHPITVDFNTFSYYNGATPEVDYQAVSGTLTFAPGETTKTLVVPVIGDELDETNESFYVNLSNASGAIIGDSSGWGSIVTDDGPIIDIDYTTLLEGDTGTSNAEFIISLSEASDETVTVDFITHDVTAIAGEDYQAVSGTLTFTPGETSQTISIPVVGDTLGEDHEQFYVGLSNATNAVLPSYNTRGWGTIYNDDQGPLLLSIDDVNLTEGNSFYTSFEYDFEIPSSSSGLKFLISDINFDTTDSNSLKDAFEIALVDANGDSLFLGIGGSNGEALAYTPTDNDAFFNFSEEPYFPDRVPGVEVRDNRLVEVNLAGITAGTEAKLIFRLINNDDDTGTSVNLTNIEIFEGDSTPVVDYRSVPPLSNDPIDIFQLSDISEQALVKYHQTSFNDKTEVLSAEVAVYQNFDGPVLVAVKGISDPSVEVVNADGFTPDGLPYYDFTNLGVGEGGSPHHVKPLSFYNPNGVQFDYELVILGQTEVTPANPDVTVGDISVTEGDTGTSQAEFVVSLSEPSDHYITLDFTTTDGTAVSGEDYQATSGTITFAPGETSKTITVPVIGDSVDEVDETFNVTLSNATNGTIADSEGVATIVDNDNSQPLQLNVSNATVLEGDTETINAQFTVTLSGSSTETVTVEYFTQDGDAIAGQDYQAVSGTITFAPGETSKDILIPILGDTVDEVDETFTLKLANPSVATVEDGEGIGTIFDDDQLLSNDIVLIEDENFGVSYEQDLTIPASSSILTFTFADLNFDTTDPNFINDAFEAALVDGEGNSLVHTLGKGQDAFFNITEGENTDLAPGVTIDGQTVKVNLTGITADTEAKLILRLVNDDSDTTTSVRITNIELMPGDGTEVTAVPTSEIASSNEPIDFTQLVDVSPSTIIEYQQTSFNEGSDILSTDVAIHNDGSYPLDGPLLVAVKGISDPSVRVANADGITPEGLPYFDFTNLVNNGSLDLNEITETKNLTFFNPDGIKFTYDLVVLSTLNSAPSITSEPDQEAIAGLPYSYDVEATDLEGDDLVYELLVAPDGATIDSTTGLINWNPTIADVANHSVVVRVSDGRGGVDLQTFTLAVVEDPANRPPVFTSTPEVDAWINQLYSYDSEAVDPDQDELTYSLILGPEGMKVHPDTGVVEWTPPPVLVLGDTVLGRISLPGENDEFSFSGAAGQRIYFDPLQYSGSHWKWDFKVYSPSGQEILNTDFTSNKILNLTETGNYRVVVDALDDHTGSYGFSLIDYNLTPIAPFDEVISGTLSPGTEDDVYRFTGNAGQKLFFDQISKTGSLDWVLYDSQNNSVISNSSFGDMELYLPKDGEYLLAVRGKSSFTSSVDYSFEIITPDEITNPMTLGDNVTSQTVSGEIAEKGEEDFYTFTGTPGQRIYFDRLFKETTSAWSHTATIISPSGHSVLNRNFNESDPEPIILDEGGTYRVRIDASGENTGSYSFNIFDLGLAEEINTDTVISGILDPGEETHFYEFEGFEGQRLFLDSPGNISGASWSLYDSGNNRISHDDLRDDMEFVLDATDTYTLAIRGTNGNNPVNYSFEVITPTEISSALSLNTPVSSEIFEKGEQDIYTFTGSKDQRVFLDTLVNAPNTRATLISPSGTKVIDTWMDEDWKQTPVILPEAGEYRLVIDGDAEDTEDYSFQLLDVSSVPSLPEETLTQGTLAAKEIQFYQFTGSEGERVYFDSQENTPNTNWHLFNANNNELYEISLSSDFEYVLPGDGDYYLMLRGESDTPVNYSFQRVVTTLPETSLLPNDLVTGEITKLGDRDVYTFIGTVGQTLYFDPHDGDSSITVEVHSPSGELVFSGDTSSDGVPITLVESGTYQVTVDGHADTTGSYSFVFQDGPTALNLGTPVNGSLDAKETVLYQFNGTAGQELDFDSLTAVSGADWVLYAPTTLLDGSSTVGSASLGSDFTNVFVLPVDGDYILAVGNNSDSAVNYDIQVNDVSPSPLTNTGLDQVYDGTLAVGGEVDSYLVTANAGTLIYFDGQGDDWRKRVRLIDPDGTNVFSNLDNQIDYGAYQLTKTGDYNLETYGHDSSTTGNYRFQLVNLKASPALILNNQTDVNLAAKEIKAYKFTGTVGQKVWLDGLNATNPDVTAKLLNSSGREIGALGDLRNDMVLQTLEADGEYYLLLQSDNTSATTASFRLLDDSGATSLDLGSNPQVTGDFGTSKRETNIYKFSGEKGQRLYFDHNNGDFHNRYTLYDPQGEQLFNQFLDRGYELPELPSDGEYTLVFRGYNRSNNNYDLQIIPSQTLEGTTSVGSVVSGEIDKLGQQHSYTFTATVGQRLWFDSLEDSSSISGTLYSPTGVEIWSQGVGDDREPTALKETGTYRFVVDSSTDNTGTYSFRFLDVANATSTNLNTDLIGNFGTSEEEAVAYRFTGTEGQYLYFDQIEGEFHDHYYLYAPDGQRLVSQFLDRDYEGDPATLPTDGEYTLVFSGRNSGSNNYNLNIVTPELVTTASNWGDNISSSISEAGEQDTYTFSGTSGQQLWFDSLLNSSSINGTLYAPSGKQVWNQGVQSNRETFVLDETGTYRFVVDGSGDNTGDYEFRFLDLAAASTVSLDENITGNFGQSQREAVAYRFTGEEGQYLFFDREEGYFSDLYYLYDQHGKKLFNRHLNSDYEGEPAILPGDGTYTVVFSGNGDANNDYDLEIVTPEFITTSYTIGDVVSNNITEAGEQDTYTFRGNKGQKLFFDSLEDPGQNIDIKLLDPDGNQVWVSDAENDVAPFTLPTDGVYQLVVDGDGDDTDNYGFRILDVDAATEINLDDGVLTGDFGASQREAHIYTFDGAEGDYIYLNRQIGSSSNQYYLYDKYDQLVVSANLTEDRELNLPTTGEYTLVLTGRGHANNDYNLEVVNPSLAKDPLTLGNTVNDEITEAGEQDSYTFSGTIGQKLFFDAVAGNGNLDARLYSPSGKLVVDRDTGANWLPFTLTEEGTYRLVIDGHYDNIGSYNFTLSDRAAATPLDFATAINDTLDPGKETKLYQFTGQQGQVLNFDLDAGSWSGANWVLYDPDNGIVASPAWHSPNFEVTLPSAGLYTLAVAGTSNDPVNYGFQVTDNTPTPVINSGLNIPLSGTLNAGETIDYNFSATSGTQIFFDSLKNSNSGIRSRLISPDGSNVFDSHIVGDDKSPFVLPQSGDYTLQIYGSNSSSAGDYEFQLLELPQDLTSTSFNPVEVGAVTSGTINGGLETEVYSFFGTAGQQILFNGITGEDVDVQLHNPNGQELFSHWSDDDGSIKALTQDGIYHVIVRNTATTSQDYSFQVLDFAHTKDLQLNLPTKGYLPTGQQGEFYKFTGTKGEKLYFESIVGNSSNHWKLYGPGNHQQLANNDLEDDFEIELLEDGEYTLYIEGGNSSSAVNYEFQVFAHDETSRDIITPGTGENGSNDEDALALFPVQLRVEDGVGGADIQEYNIRLGADPDNTNPAITSSPVTKYGLNQKAYRYQLDALDPDGDNLSYRLVDAPLGAFIDRDTGELLWLPEEGIATGENYEFTVEVADGRGGKDRQTFNVDIHESLGKIRGAVWEDLNNNGYRDIDMVQGDNPDVVFVIDVSGSAGSRTIDWTQTDLEDFVEGSASILDMELATAIALSEQLALQGRDNTKIGVVLFASDAGILDMDPSTPGTQLYTTPSADNNNNGIADIKEAFNSPFFSGGTNFTPGLTTAEGLLNSLSGDPNIIFMSDGVGSLDTTVVDDLKANGVNITGFGIGGGAAMGQIRKIDPEAIKITDVQEIVDIFSGWDDRYTTEPFMEGVTVYLDLNDNGQLDAEEPWQVTEPDDGQSLLGTTPFQYTFDNLEPGTYTVRQLVPSGYEETAPVSGSFVDTITVTGGETFGHLFGNHKIGEPPNQAPELITTAPTETLAVGDSFVYQAVATDPDADKLTYDLPLAPSGIAIDPETGAVIWQPQEGEVGTFEVIVRVQDGRGGIDLEYFQVEVAPPNNAPLFTSVVPEDSTPQLGRPFQYRATAVDADGDEITYELVGVTPGIAIDSSTGLLTWTPGQLGEKEITIKASDGNGGEAFQTLNLEVIEPQANRNPEITSIPRTNTIIGNSYFYRVTASDPDGDPLTYEFLQRPEGMLMSERGEIIFVPDAEQFGTHTVEIEVSDGQGGTTTQLFELSVSDRALNRPPTITSTPEVTTNIQRLYEYQLTATDPDGDLLLWQLGSAARGMVIDTETGVLTWQPEATQIGEHTVTVEVVDSQGLLSGQEYTLKVTGTNAPPAIVSTPITQAAVGQGYNYQAIATDPENDILTYTLALSPEGMTIDAATGEITWSPTSEQLGEQVVEVLVEDTQGGSNRQRFTVEVQAQAINNAPEITSTPVPLADTGNGYSYQVTATDVDNDNLTYELIAAPNGVDIDPQTGEITWNNPTVGSHQIVVGVNDGQLGAAQGYTLTVFANQAPQITADPVITAIPNQPYSYDLKAFDPEGQTLTYSLDQASEDLGMTLDEYGRLRWSPTNTDIGNHSVTVTVTDPLGATDQRTYNLTVTADTEAPKAKLLISDVYVVGDELQGDINQQIRLQVLATDNIGVTGLQLLINNQPVAIDSNGLATITLDELGTTTAKVVAYDAAGNVGIATDEILVLDPANNDPPVVSLALTETEITAPIDIVGTVSDGNDDLDYYVLEVAPADGSGPFVEMARGTSEVDDGVLGEFDPTVLANGSYILKLTAYDAAGNFSSTEEVVDVTGNLKLGNFTLSFTDMEIPVSGIPITVTRTYDSLNANYSDDFGYGWRLEFRDTDLRTSVEPPDQIQQELGEYSPFKDGTKVYITLPGGKREAFTFKGRPDPLNQYMRGLLGRGERQEAEAQGLDPEDPDQLKQVQVNEDVGLYHPEFESEEGSTNTLTVKDFRLLGNGGDYYGLVGRPYNPADSYFGGVYTLTTQEGIAYDIDGATGDLLTVTDTNGNTLTFSDDGISSDTGVSVTFERDAEGRIVKAIDPEGEEVKYEYDDNGDLVAVTDRENNTTQLKYEEPSRPHFLTEIIDPLGRTGVKTEYDEKGRLKKLLDVNGEAVELDYDPDNSIQTVKDVFGNPTTYEYDIRGNVLTEIDAVGKVTKRTYDGDNNVLTETIITNESGPDGWTTTYTYDGQNNILTEEDHLGNIIRYSYNEYGRLLSKTDALGNTTEYKYSPRGNLRFSTDAAGNVTEYGNDLRGNLTRIVDAEGNSSRFGYDDYGNVLSVTDAEGNQTTFTYDAQGNRETETRTVTTPDGVEELLTKWDYDSEGRLKSVTDAENQTITYEYDANGNQTLIIDAKGNKTEYRYDSKGQLVETIYADGTADDLSDNPRSITVYDRGGRSRASIDQEGYVTHYEYDAVGRLVATIYPDESSNQVEQLLAVIAPGETPQTVDWTEVIYPDEVPGYLVDNPRSGTEYYQDGSVKAQIDGSGNRTEYRYNDLRQLVEVIAADDTPDDLTDNPTSTTEYDDAGRVVKQTDARSNTTSFVYDDLGRLIETHFQDGTFSKTEYDKLGRKIATTEQEGNITKYEHDNLGRLTDVVQYLEDNKEVRTKYGYDEVGRLIWTEDANDHRTEYEYDLAGRRTVVKLPEGQSSVTTYDEVGNVKTVTDFNGEVMTYYYDEQNRLEIKDLEDDADVSYTYTIDGQIETITDGRGVTRFDYDELGRLIARQDPDNPYLPSGNTIEYDYNDAGNISEIRTPAGTVTYGYDEQNRLETVTEDGETTTYVYDAVGNLKETQFPNGVVERQTYDELNRLQVLETVKVDAGVETLLTKFEYDLDNVGHRLEVKETLRQPDDSLLERTVKYEYDDLYRLTSEEVVGGDKITFTYDDVGNRASQTINGVTTTYVYDDNDRLLEELINGVVVVSYTYDANGNTKSRTKDGVTTDYIWDDQNRLVEVQTPDGSVNYAYDDENIRVSETVDGVTTSYLLDKNRPYGQVLAEYTDGVLDASYTYGLDLIEQERDGDESYYNVDGLGSTRGLTDENGEVTDSYVYDAFGNLVAEVGDTENSYRFAGEQFDERLGQYYLRQRYYEPATGRFTRRDTYEGRLGEPITLHKYVYGNANPVNYTDPSGFFGLAEFSAAESIRNTLASIQIDFGSNAVQSLLSEKDTTPSDLLINNLLASAAPIVIGVFGAGLGKAAKTVIQGLPRGGGRIFAHFTSLDAINGITGISKSKLRKLKVGQGYTVRKLKFAKGKNAFNTNKPGDIFLTELPVDASTGQLNQIGVFGEKQSFAILISEETAVTRNNILIRGATFDSDRSIFTMPGGRKLQGKFLVVRVR